MNSGESSSDALEFEFVKESLSISSASERSYESTFDRVTNLRGILGKFSRGRRMLRMVELGEDAEDVYGRTTTRPCYFACTDTERRRLLIVAAVAVVDTSRREARYGKGVGEVDGARGNNLSGFYVLGSIVTSIIRGISLLGSTPACGAWSVVLLRVFERIRRRRRLQPRHGGL